jgi:hypothetical protein
MYIQNRDVNITWHRLTNSDVTHASGMLGCREDPEVLYESGAIPLEQDVYVPLFNVTE